MAEYDAIAGKPKRPAVARSNCPVVATVAAAGALHKKPAVAFAATPVYTTDVASGIDPAARNRRSPDSGQNANQHDSDCGSIGIRKSRDSYDGTAALMLTSLRLVLC